MTPARLTHIGGPTLLIETGGWTILTDPTFDPPGQRYAFGWGTSSRKTAGPALAPDHLPPIDAILLTHDHHADNLDITGRAILPRAGRVITTTAGSRRLENAQGLSPWQTTTLADGHRETITITATPSRHGPPLSRPLTGATIGFALDIPSRNGGAIWITGDTVLSRAVRRVPRRIEVDTLVIHLGGVRFPITGRLRYTMTARDAIELSELTRPTAIVPIHYEGWQHFHEHPDDLRSTLTREPHVQPLVRWLEPGVPALL